jgi:hypothetical protein
MCGIRISHCERPRLGKAGFARLGVFCSSNSLFKGGDGGAILLNIIPIKEVILV